MRKTTASPDYSFRTEIEISPQVDVQVLVLSFKHNVRHANIHVSANTCAIERNSFARIECYQLVLNSVWHRQADVHARSQRMRISGASMYFKYCEYLAARSAPTLTVPSQTGDTARTPSSVRFVDPTGSAKLHGWYGDVWADG